MHSCRPSDRRELTAIVSTSDLDDNYDYLLHVVDLHKHQTHSRSPRRYLLGLFPARHISGGFFHNCVDHGADNGHGAVAYHHYDLQEEPAGKENDYHRVSQDYDRIHHHNGNSSRDGFGGDGGDSEGGYCH